MSDLRDIREFTVTDILDCTDIRHFTEVRDLRLHSLEMRAFFIFFGRLHRYAQLHRHLRLKYMLFRGASNF